MTRAELWDHGKTACIKAFALLGLLMSPWIIGGMHGFPVG